MIQRIIPFVIGITLFISGCATQQDKQGTADFNAGTTLLKIAHLPSPTADGSSLYITVDGKDAGLLPVGEAILLQVPAGEHQVGGYASSLIGHVTIPGLTVTTSADSPRFVAYRVTRNAPLFIERGVDPLPDSAPIPKKQVAQSEALPVPQIMELSVPAADTVPDAPKALTPDNSGSATPAVQEQASPASTLTPPPVAGASESPKEATSTAKPVEAPATPSQPAAAQGADTVSPPAAAQDVKRPKPSEAPSAETPATQQKTSTVPASQ